MTTQLVDTLGRGHTDLRISVTDRCNIRCFYCMPEGPITFKARDEILTFEEIERFVRTVAHMGVDKLRITGGEPLLRQQLPKLIGRLVGIAGIRDIALTTNGMLLPDCAEELRRAGVRRLNISLDTLSEDTFFKISRRHGLDKVLAGIAAAKQAGFDKIKLNALAIREVTESDVVPLARFARQEGLQLRFIEYMPLDAEDHWEHKSVLSGSVIRKHIEDSIGPLVPEERIHPSQPATDYRFTDGSGSIGFINPVTEPFCGDCNRLRLTAEGQVRNCLFSTREWDARQVMRCGGSDEDLAELAREAVWAKAPGHGIGSDHFVKPERAMYQIGG